MFALTSKEPKNPGENKTRFKVGPIRSDVGITRRNGCKNKWIIVGLGAYPKNSWEKIL